MKATICSAGALLLGALPLFGCTMVRDYRSLVFGDPVAQPVSLSENAAESPECESASSIPAAAVLPAELRQGSGFKVQSQVQADGLMYYIKVDSDAGSFSAYGLSELAAFVAELPLVIEMQNVAAADIVANEAVDSTTSPYRSAGHLLTNPVGALTRVPAALGSLYHRVGDWGSRAVSAIQEARAELGSGESEKLREKYLALGLDFADRWADDYVGYAKYKRDFAARFKVDPYSTNPLVQTELRRFASGAIVGKYAAKLVPHVPYVGYASKVEGALWNADSKDLAADIAARFEKAGISESTSKALVRSDVFSPPQLLQIAAAFGRLPNAANKDELARSLADMHNRSFAVLMTDEYTLLADAAKTHPFVRLGLLHILPYGETANGTLVLPNAADDLRWVPNVRNFFNEIQVPQGARKKILYSQGRVSSRARAELRKRGWIIEAPRRSAMRAGYPIKQGVHVELAAQTAARSALQR